MIQTLEWLCHKSLYLAIGIVEFLQAIFRSNRSLLSLGNQQDVEEPEIKLYKISKCSSKLGMMILNQLTQIPLYKT